MRSVTSPLDQGLTRACAGWIQIGVKRTPPLLWESEFGDLTGNRYHSSGGPVPNWPGPREFFLAKRYLPLWNG